MKSLVLYGALFGLLAFVAHWAWTTIAATGLDMSIHGWIALGLGIFFSLVVGIGLMALVFYSHRKGYDRLD